ncbi:hypothetical protein ACP70R_033062 [Stipagrostis hirtigluma subsp. patula]
MRGCGCGAARPWVGAAASAGQRRLRGGTATRGVGYRVAAYGRRGGCGSTRPRGGTRVPRRRKACARRTGRGTTQHDGLGGCGLRRGGQLQCDEGLHLGSATRRPARRSGGA